MTVTKGCKVACPYLLCCQSAAPEGFVDIKPAATHPRGHPEQQTAHAPVTTMVMLTPVVGLVAGTHAISMGWGGGAGTGAGGGVAGGGVLGSGAGTGAGVGGAGTAGVGGGTTGGEGTGTGLGGDGTGTGLGGDGTGTGLGGGGTGEGLGLGEGEGLGDGDGDGDGEGLGLGDGEGLGDGDGEGLGAGDGAGDRGNCRAMDTRRWNQARVVHAVASPLPGPRDASSNCRHPRHARAHHGPLPSRARCAPRRRPPARAGAPGSWG